MEEFLKVIIKYSITIWIITGILILALIGYLVEKKRNKDFKIKEKVTKVKKEKKIKSKKQKALEKDIEDL